jgi:hypothetical protein
MSRAAELVTDEPIAKLGVVAVDVADDVHEVGVVPLAV